MNDLLKHDQTIQTLERLCAPLFPSAYTRIKEK